MRLAINAITDELRRLKAGGQGSISVSEEGLQALRRSMAGRPAAVQAAPPRTAAPVAAATAEPVAKPTAAKPAPAVETPAFPLPVVVLPPGDKATRMAALRALVLADPLCVSKLRAGKKMVTGVGNLDAQIMFIGDAPGAEEEVQGEPFLGEAGQLLNRMISGMALARADVYLSYLVSWRPEQPAGSKGVQTGSVAPAEAEITHCLPYLRAQIDIVQPQLLVALGATAAKALLAPRAFGALGEVRGHWHEFAGRPLMVTYHPNYILRAPTNRTKRPVWEDLLKVMERANLPVTEKQRGYFL